MAKQCKRNPCVCYEDNWRIGHDAVVTARQSCDWWQEEAPTINQASPINHPPHYGGEDNPYEAIKVIEAWKLGFNLGNTIKYISRAGKKGNALEDLKKAQWYLAREIANLEKGS